MNGMLLFQEAANDSLAYPVDELESINVANNAIVLSFKTSVATEDLVTLAVSGDEWVGLNRLCEAIGGLSGSILNPTLVVYDKVGGVDVTGIATGVTVA